MTPARIYQFAHEKAEPSATKGGVCWLNHEDGSNDGEDYCRECITALPMLPGLVALLLLSLAHLPLPRCPSEDEKWRYNRSWGKYLLDKAERVRDGGWSQGADSFRTCSACDSDLEFTPTDYFVDSEIEHWETGGPPDSPRQWWEFTLMLDGLVNYWMPDAEKDPSWIEVCKLMDKWELSPLPITERDDRKGGTE